MEFLKNVAGSTEFIATLVGAIVGGFATFRASSSQTKKVLRQERAMVAAATAREAAVILLECHARVRSHLDELDTPKWHLVPYPSGVGMHREKTHHPAIEALEDAQRLDTSRAKLLPLDLRGIWYEFVLLLGEYRNFLTTTEADDWPDGKRNRVHADVPAYMDYVANALAEFIRTGEVVKRVDRPVLRRDDLDTWTAPTD